MAGSAPSTALAFSWMAVRNSMSVNTRLTSTPSCATRWRMKRPKASLPTRLAQPTFKPSRARPMATLVSAPARRRVYFSTSSKGPTSSATSRARASPQVTTSSSIASSVIVAFTYTVLYRRQHGHVAARRFFQVAAHQRELDGPQDAAREMGHQRLPVAVLRLQRHRLQHALVVLHALAMHVAHMRRQRARRHLGVHALPVPVAHVEGHAEGIAIAGTQRQETDDGLQSAALRGLVVLQQDFDGGMREEAQQRLQVAGRREMPQRYLQETRPDFFGLAHGQGDLFAVETSIGAEQLERRRIDREQLVLGQQVTQGRQVLRPVEELAPYLQPRRPGGRHHLHQVGMADTPHQVGAIGRCGHQDRAHLSAPAPMNCLASGVCGSAKNSSEGRASHTLPWCMKTVRSATRRANSISCVTSSMVMPPRASSSITFSTSAVSSGSSAEVTSSNSITCGSMASERAMATRCCWPPESCSGQASRLCSRPTCFNTLMAVSRAVSVAVFLTMRGDSMMFSSTVRCGKRLQCWNTIPTSLRSSIRCSCLLVSLWPATVMLPPSMLSSPLMQRSMVLLPEPERPMMATTWPRSTDSEIPFRTWLLPKRLVMLSISTMGMQFPLKGEADARQRIAEYEVDAGHDGEDQEGLEGRIADQLARLGQFHQADDGGDRGVLDDLHQEAHGGRQRDAHRLRQDHVAQLLPARHGQGGGGFPLRYRHGLDATAPDLAQVGAGVDGHGNGGGHHGGQLVAEDRQSVERQEQDDQHRRALDDLDIHRREQAQRADVRGAHQGHDEPGDAATDEGQHRQQQRPLRRFQQEDEIIKGKFSEHYILLGRATPRRRRRLNTTRPISQKASRNSNASRMQSTITTRQISKLRKVSASSRLAVAVSSSAEIAETMLEASIISVNWLARAGQTFSSAGVSTTWRITCPRVMASACAASICEGWMAIMPARTISVEQAPRLTVIATSAAMLASTCTPMEGRPKKMMNSWTRKGVLRISSTQDVTAKRAGALPWMEMMAPKIPTAKPQIIDSALSRMVSSAPYSNWSRCWKMNAN
eukprot:TRINITY_DN1031_c0_g5_i1.p1 TRINITY_DN1031_c0_g5~~TRINITY_DN1031_c0_g5_i1.p1  ORF type:complete len:1047 (+),score=351.32 TRINITY_DN1031_c0_g5_i1:737-3877(+)